MTNERELELEEIRKLAFEALRNFKEDRNKFGGSLQSRTFWGEIAVIASDKGLKPPYDHPNKADLTEKENARAREVMSNFFSEGLLMWGSNKHNPDPPFMAITEYGDKVLESDSLIPHDPENYLKRFKENIPESNDLIIQYLSESINTYRHNHLFSSSVMLGVASEAAFYDLFFTLSNTLTNPKKITKFEKLERDTSLRKKFDAVFAEIMTFQKLLPSKLEENLESNLKGIFTLIRNQRNDSGHPTGKNMSKEGLFGYLQLFTMYCRDLYALVNWLKSNPKWESKLNNHNS